MEILSKKIKQIVDIETGGNIHKFSNEYLDEERSDKLRAWIKGTKDPNLNEIDKFIRAVTKKNGKKINSLQRIFPLYDAV